ncbi:MAG: hypothetical protein VST67_10260, partial [Nitrospirota bacterium]|nr:hypothetical protein [Nitrospirota bacterium]
MLPPSHGFPILHLIPSCWPDRLLQRSDFIPRVPQDQRGTETAIRFLHHPSQHSLSIAFDYEYSWVRSNLIDPKMSNFGVHLNICLAHE